jgi:hypothetical protein
VTGRPPSLGGRKKSSGRGLYQPDFFRGGRTGVRRAQLGGAPRAAVGSADRLRSPHRLCSLARNGYILSLFQSGEVRTMPKTERDREISRRRQRKQKLLFLKQRLAEAKDSKTRAAIAAKILKINPLANVAQK